MGVKAHTPLAGERLRPLGHLSVSWRTYYCLPKISQTIFKKQYPFELFLSMLTVYPPKNAYYQTFKNQKIKKPVKKLASKILSIHQTTIRNFRLQGQSLIFQIECVGKSLHDGQRLL